MIPPVINLSWLQQHQSDVVLADVRWYLDGRSGRDMYEQGHIPGAIFVDLDGVLSGQGSPAAGRHPLPDPETFAAEMSQLGISNDAIVVAYDDAGGVMAARLVWMLRAIGQDAALLDGGLKAYPEPLQIGAVSRAPATFQVRSWPPNRLADIDDASNGTNVVIDARNRDRYEGAPDPLDPRSGHIPGARNVPCRENLDANGAFLPADQIRQRFLDAGVTDGEQVVSYCGSGVTACHNLLALEHVGLGKGRLYPGSWSQYSSAPDREVATGPQP